MLKRAAANTAATLTVVGCVLGCSGDDPAGQDRADTVPEVSATSAPSSTSTPTAGALTAAQARSSLLTIDDMETGWTVLPKVPPGRYAPARCRIVGGWPRVGGNPTTRVDAGFTNDPDYGRRIEHVIASWSTPAAPYLAAYRQAVAGCPTFTISGARIKVSPLSFPKLGNATFAFRMNMDLGSAKYVFDVVTVAVGNAVTLVSVGDIRPVPGNELENLVQITVDRLESVQ